MANEALIKGQGSSMPDNPDEKKITVNLDESQRLSLFGYLANCINIGDILAGISRGSRLIVRFPTKALEKAYNEGKYVLNLGKDGETQWPSLVKVLKGGKREFVANLPVENEFYLKGDPIRLLSDGFANMILQKKLDNLESLCKAIYENTEKILAGQRNDRIGDFLAGKKRLEAALKESNIEERDKGISSAIDLLYIAQGKFLAGLKSGVLQFAPLPSSKVRRTWQNIKESGRYYGKKDDEINDIAFYYDMYLESTKLIAIAYAYLGNKDEMVHHVFDDAMAELGALRFTRLKTIDYIHPNSDNSCKFYHVALEHFHEEKKQVFLETKPYDYIEYEVTKGELERGIKAWEKDMTVKD